MNTLNAIMICEHEVPSDHEEEREAWQHLIDTAIVWQLQGWYGRTATRLIEEGICTVKEATQ